MKCSVCEGAAATSLRLGRFELQFCASHAAAAKAAGKELLNLTARAAGAAAQKKWPAAFGAGQAVFTALKVAQAKGSSTSEG